MPKVNLVKKIVFIASLISVSACGAKVGDDKSEIKASDTSSVIMKQLEIDSLIKKGINQGDCDSYQKAIVNRHLSNDAYSLFGYSQIMANKYNCAIAYYYVGFNLENIAHMGENIKSFQDIDNKTKSMILFNYLKSYELGNESAKYTLYEYFGKDEKKFPKSCDYIVFRKLNGSDDKGC